MLGFIERVKFSRRLFEVLRISEPLADLFWYRFQVSGEECWKEHEKRGNRKQPFVFVFAAVKFAISPGIFDPQFRPLIVFTCTRRGPEYVYVNAGGRSIFHRKVSSESKRKVYLISLLKVKRGKEIHVIQLKIKVI